MVTDRYQLDLIQFKLELAQDHMFGITWILIFLHLQE